MRVKLESALAPTALAIEDESHRHIGHPGSRPGGETHFRVEIVSARFEGLSRIKRHRLVHDVLRDDLRERVHALNIATLTPDEAARRA